MKHLGWLFVIVEEENHCCLLILVPVSQFPLSAPVVARFIFVLSASEVQL